MTDQPKFQIGNIQAGNVQVGNQNVINVSVAWDRIPPELARGLEAFQTEASRSLKAQGASTQDVKEVASAVEQLAHEVEDLDPDVTVEAERQRGIENGLVRIARGLLRHTPATAEVVAAMTPLAPFAKLVRKGLDAIVGRVAGTADGPE